VADWTHKNLRDVEDQAPGFGFQDVQSARFAYEALEARSTGVCLMGVKAGQRQAFAHRHENAEEVYVILSGSGRCKLDEDIIEVGPARRDPRRPRRGPRLRGRRLGSRAARVRPPLPG